VLTLIAVLHNKMGRKGNFDAFDQRPVLAFALPGKYFAYPNKNGLAPAGARGCNGFA